MSRSLNRHFTKMFMKLHSLEEFKYLPPKFSCAYLDLWDLFEIHVEDSKQNQEFNSIHSRSVFTSKKQPKKKSASRSSTGSVKNRAPAPRNKSKKNSEGMNSSVYSSGSSIDYSKYERHMRENRTNKNRK